jgi:hypothetical protein
MSYQGDFTPGDVIDFKFTTVNSTGGPVTPTGLAVAVYKDTNTTESTAGLTLTVAFDGRAGLHHVHITTASDATFYAAGSYFAVVITVGTAPPLAGYVVGEFSLQARVPNMAQAEPGQGAPPASASPMTKLAYLYKAWRNKKTQTATQWSLFADDTTTIDQKTSVSDDGTTATKNEIATGP